MENSLLQPKDVAKLAGINISTLNGYLSDVEAFPPAHTAENGYRYYASEIVSWLILFKALRKKPYRLKINEIKAAFKELEVNEMVRLYETSNDALYQYLKSTNYL